MVTGLKIITFVVVCILGAKYWTDTREKGVGPTAFIVDVVPNITGI